MNEEEFAKYAAGVEADREEMEREDEAILAFLGECGEAFRTVDDGNVDADLIDRVLIDSELDVTVGSDSAEAVLVLATA